MEQIYTHHSTGPAATDLISIQLYSKHKLTQDIKAELAHHFTHKLPKPKGNRMLIIGARIGAMMKLMAPYCSHIDAISQQKYLPLLQAIFIKRQAVEYTFNRQGYIGQKHIIPKYKQNTECKFQIIQISKFHDNIKKDSFYDIILLQNVIVHPQINILKQLMRLRHSVLITMIVPGKIVHQNLFQLLSGIQENILHVFYDQATHERLEYVRYITGRRKQINIWQIFVWLKKQTSDVKVQLTKVSSILEEQVKKNFVKAQIKVGAKGKAFYQTQASVETYLDLHYGEHEYFGVKNFPLNCANKIIDNSKLQNIQGRVLDIGCAVGRSTIQLVKYFDQAVGVQYSQYFVEAAKQVLNEKYNELVNKVKFVHGDPCNLDSSLGKFDVIFGGNLIDRLQDPQAFLNQITKFLKEKALIILTSPYTWLEEYTKVEKWLGSKQINGKDVTSYQRLRQIFTGLGLKELKNPEDIIYVIKQNPWVYQYTKAQMTFWIKLQQ